MPEVLEHKQSRFLIKMFESLRRAFAAGNSTDLDAASNFYKFILHNLDRSKSQLFQDLFVLFVLKEKRNGYFVEFGATNGVDLSNTYLLEKSYGWNGILAEPARCWLRDLKGNRNSSLDFRCVWEETGKSVSFNETNFAELSTIDEFSGRSDELLQARLAGKKYAVDTVSLEDLVRAHNAPAEIDYLSIDTEGSEFRILRSYDFKKRTIRLITVEHNNVTPDRDDIFSLLTANGYIRLFDLLSDCDDWYVHKSVFTATPPAEPCPCGSALVYQHCHGAVLS